MGCSFAVGKLESPFGRAAFLFSLVTSRVKRAGVCAAALLVCCLPLLTSAASAETINYDGTQALQTAPDPSSTPSSLFPGTTADPFASGNTITIDFSSGPNPVRVFGGISNTGDSGDNTVNLLNGTIANRIYGSYSGGAVGNATGNVVSIYGGTVVDRAVGGHSINGDSQLNRLSMSGGTALYLYGGSTDGAASTSSGNSVTISGSALVTRNACGGSAELTGTAMGNSVTITGGQLGDGAAGVNGWAVGGFSVAGQVEGNSVTISGGIVNHVVGGEGAGNGLVAGNRVEISGGTVLGVFRGGFSAAGRVEGNRIDMSGGTADGGLNGGESFTGEVVGNTVNVSGGTVKNEITGGLIFWGSGSVSSNTVHISGNANVTGNVFGGNVGAGGAEDNLVTVSGGAISGGVLGASAGGFVGGNRVIVSGGVIGSYVSGGSSSAGNASGNSVLVNGNATVGTIHGASAHEGIASDNSVSIGGSATVTGNVYGGVAGQNAASATHNTVTLFDAPDLSASILYGGGTTLGATGDMFTGNTLNVNAFQGSVKGAHNFQNYNFALPASVANGGTILNITDGAATDLTNANVLITGMAGGGAPLGVGENITLISRTSGTPANVSTLARGGIALLYDFGLDAASGALVATVRSAQANPQLKSLSEGRLAGLAFLNQGSDLLSGPGLYSALLATQRQSYGLAPFAALGGGGSRYNTGSRINVDGFSMLTGLAWRAPLQGKNGSFLAGAFFEAGWGKYDSYNSFSLLPSVAGNGDTKYYGGGVLARYERPVGQGGLYAEASVRAGRVSTGFSSNDNLGGGQQTAFDSSSAYYGAHAGLGYIWNITDRASLDLSTRYLWTRQSSASVTIQGDRIRFAAVNSQRWRTGARFAYAVNDFILPYLGAYYDYEFDGKARAVTHGYAIDAPDLTGGTGVGELGLTIKPARPFASGAARGLSFDLGLRGYIGVRKGLTGTFQLKWEF